MDIYERSEYHVLTVGDTPTPFPVCNKYGRVKQPEAIFIQSPSNNSDLIHIGESNVANDFSTGAIVMPIGGDTVLPMFNENLLFANSATAGQKLMVIYLAGRLR